MARIDNPSIWEKIQKNVQETERLIGQKKYNQAMVKARQTLEYMVKLHCDKAGIVEGSMDSMIRELYEGKWISKSTAEHYMQLLSIGNKAVRENDNNAYNANQAHHILSQEIYSFANDDTAPRPRRQISGERGERSERNSQTRSRRRQTKSGLNRSDLFKLLIPVALIIVLIIIIRIFTPKQTPTSEPTTAPTTTIAESMAETEPSTEAPTTAAALTYRTTDTLNIRNAPSTDGERIGKLDPGTSVEVLEEIDEGNGRWARISFNNQDAYVSMDYLSSAQ